MSLISSRVRTHAAAAAGYRGRETQCPGRAGAKRPRVRLRLALAAVTAGALRHEGCSLVNVSEVHKLKDENAILGKAIEELLKNQEPSKGIVLQNLMKENGTLR